MRRRIGLSVAVAALLIGGALWSRVHRTYAEPQSLVAVSTSTEQPADASSLINLYTKPTEEAATSSTNLTDTDLIARQLLSDYVSLSQNGQATNENLAALGDEYASNIVSINKAPTIDYGDISVTGNDRTAMQAYADNLSAIYQRYGNELLQLTSGASDPASGGDFSGTTKQLAVLYKAEAAALMRTIAPGVFADNHIKLINLYLKDAWALDILSNPKNDPSDEYAAMANESSSSDEEKTILTSIESAFKANGIIPNTK